jgi:hypothetical protein
MLLDLWLQHVAAVLVVPSYRRARKVKRKKPGELLYRGEAPTRSWKHACGGQRSGKGCFAPAPLGRSASESPLWIASMLMTTAYYLGYSDFRSATQLNGNSH